MQHIISFMFLKIYILLFLLGRTEQIESDLSDNVEGQGESTLTMQQEQRDLEDESLAKRVHILSPLG